MRSFCFLRPMTWLILVLVLTACAGGDSSSDSDKSNTNTQPQVSATTDSGPAPTTDGSGGQSDSDVAARVNGQTISMETFQRERSRRAMGMTAEPASAAAFDMTVLQDLIDQVLVEQYAATAGISVSDAEVDAELDAQSQIATQSNSSLDQFVAAQSYTMDEYRAAQRSILLWQKVAEQVTASVSATSAQVHARHILVADEAVAADLINQLNQGADFAALASQYSLDGSTARSGGDLSWVSPGDLLQPEVEAAVFALQPGQLSPQPVRSSLGYHIIEVLERVEDRPIDEAHLAEKKGQAFLGWLQNQRASASIEIFISTGQ